MSKKLNSLLQQIFYINLQLYSNTQSQNQENNYYTFHLILSFQSKGFGELERKFNKSLKSQNLLD